MPRQVDQRQQEIAGFGGELFRVATVERGLDLVLVSAETGEGIDALLTAIEDRLAATRTTLDLSIDAADGAGISWLHRNSEVLTKQLHDCRFDMTVRVDETKRDIVVNRFDAVPRVA